MIRGPLRSFVLTSRQTHQLRSLSTLADKPIDLKLNGLMPSQRKRVEQIIRVNQAGELGAIHIYKGQLAVLKNTQDGPVLKHMLEQEMAHYNTFNKIVGANNIRPTALWPLWRVAGFTLGYITASMGREAAMMCTEAVETVIGQHYNDQLRDIHNIKHEEYDELRRCIRKFRDEELEHLDHAVENDAQKAPLYAVMTSAIQGGCKAAIWISERI